MTFFVRESYFLCCSLQPGNIIRFLELTKILIPTDMLVLCTSCAKCFIYWANGGIWAQTISSVGEWALCSRKTFTLVRSNKSALLLCVSCGKLGDGLQANERYDNIFGNLRAFCLLLVDSLADWRSDGHQLVFSMTTLSLVGYLPLINIFILWTWNHEVATSR